MQADLYDKPFDKYQQLKSRNTFYGFLPLKIIVELKPWDSFNVYPLVLYAKSKREQHPVSAIINNYVILDYMIIINPMKVWFKNI